MKWLPLIFFFFLLSCSGEGEQSDKKVFRYNESSGITGLDPAFARNLEELWLVNQLFDGLVEIGNDMNIKPLISKSWEISEDGRTYKFALRNDVYFHDNQLFKNSELSKGLTTRRVVAEDFVYSFNRIIDPKLASPGQWVFSNIDLNKNNGFYALGKDTLVIHLKEAFTPFLGMLSMQYFDVVPREIEKIDPVKFRTEPIGTGPFKFAFWYDQIALVLHKNESFYEMDEDGNSLPYMDAIKVDFVKDMNSEYLGLLKGSYDFMSGINPAFKDELLDSEGDLNDLYADQIYFQKVPFIKTDYLGILVDDSLDISVYSPFSNKQFRQAINMSIDREKMVKYLRNNSVFPAGHGFIPKGLPSYDQNLNYGFEYDPEQGKRLINQLKEEGKYGGEEITLSTTKDYVDLCEYIQHNLGEIGIDLKIDVLPSSTHREYVSKSKLSFFRKSWLADYVDAENFMSLFYSPNFCPSGPNYTHFRNKEYDELFEMARSEIDQNKRRVLYAKMDSIVMEESPVIPLFYDQVSHFISNDIENFETNPFNLLDLKEVRKK